MTNRKKAVTPVIATIILIAGTLVLALVVGAYTFGLFGSNVKTVTLSSATLYGGTEAAAIGPTGGPPTTTTYISFALNNPGSGTYIDGMTLTGSAIGTISTWEDSTGAALSTLQTGTNNQMNGGIVTTFTVYPYGTSQNIVTGQVYNYVINFANGQSVSGSLIAQ